MEFLHTGTNNKDCIMPGHVRKRTEVKVLETSVMKDVDQVLSAYHIFHWRNNTGMTRIGKRFVRFGYPGSSDWLGICPDGRLLAVECKRPEGGRLTEQQRDFLDCVNRNGGVGIVATGVDSLIKQLKEAEVI
jgi:hypothetical protein